MINRKIKKIRRQVIDLVLFGVEALFIAECPDDPAGKGSCYMVGVGNTPKDAGNCSRRILNELKVQLRKYGLELDYTLSEIEEKEDEE